MARSDTGEYSIKRRNDGYYHTRIRVPQPNGTTKPKDIYGKTPKEVREKLRKALADKEAGATNFDERTTLAQFLETWLELVRTNKADRTYNSYRGAVDDHIVPCIGSVRIKELTPQHIILLRTTTANKGLTRTVQYAHDVLKRALNVALRWGLVTRNVATLVETYKPTPAKKHTITPDEARRLLAALEGDRYGPLIRVALLCGLRRGECLALQWQDVDIGAGTLRVCASSQRYNGKVRRGKTKTRNVRVLQLPTSLVEMLRQHRALWPNTTYVFVNTQGNPVDPRHLQQAFKAALQRAGLPDSIRFHDLRHAAATFMALQGVPPKTAARVLGHNDIKTTLAIYTETLPEMNASALEKVANLF